MSSSPLMYHHHLSWCTCAIHLFIIVQMAVYPLLPLFYAPLSLSFTHLYLICCHVSPHSSDVKVTMSLFMVFGALINSYVLNVLFDSHVSLPLLPLSTPDTEFSYTHHTYSPLNMTFLYYTLICPPPLIVHIESFCS